MIPISPAHLTALLAAVKSLAAAFATGAAGDAGKSAWARVQKIFGWRASPDAATVDRDVTAKLEANPEIAKDLLHILQSQPTSHATAPTSWGQLVGHIDAEKVIVIGTNQGPINM